MILLLGTILAFQSIIPAMAETQTTDTEIEIPETETEETETMEAEIAETTALATETKIDLDGTYMNVIQFGSGDKNLIILSGVSLSGLEGKGEGVAAAYSRFTDDYTVYLFDWKKVLPDGYQVADMAEDVYRVLNILGVEDAYVYGVSQGGTPEDCERFVVLAQACLDFDITDSLDQIQCPVLVLGDENDHTIGVEGSRELAELLNCSSYIYDQYSHAVYDEAPDIQEKIYTFLDTLQ